MLERLRTRTLDPDQPREVVFAALAIVTVAAAPGVGRKWATAGVLLVAIVAYLALTRGAHRYAPAAFLICAAGGIASILLAPSGVGEWPVLMCAVYCRVTFKGRTGVVVTAVLAVGFAVAIVWISHSAVGILAGLGVPVLAQRRLEQGELQAERDRALALLAELEAARDAQAQAAALEERGRIAREMHDVLAHSLAGLSLQLQAVRAVAGREGVSPEVIEPLDRAAALARSGVEEAKAVVGALREAAPLGLGALPLLIERFPGDATFATAGTPVPIDLELGHALYRVVQESLTNAARYAPGSPVRVALSWAPERLSLRVEDDGPGDHSVVAGQGTGHGLRGMRERLSAFGAELEAGPWQRGWRVAVRVPLPAGAVA